MQFRIQKKEESVTKTIRIPESLYEFVQDLAKTNDTSINEVIIQCISFAMQNIESSNDECNT